MSICWPHTHTHRRMRSRSPMLHTFFSLAAFLRVLGLFHNCCAQGPSLMKGSRGRRKTTRGTDGPSGGLSYAGRKGPAAHTADLLDFPREREWKKRPAGRPFLLLITNCGGFFRSDVTEGRKKERGVMVALDSKSHLLKTEPRLKQQAPTLYTRHAEPLKIAWCGISSCGCVARACRLLR